MEALICDNGTGFLKLGWSNSNFPDLVLPNVIGRPNRRYVGWEAELEKDFIGHEALEHQHTLNLSRPMASGEVQDWEGMLKIWEYAFLDKLDVNLPDTNILMTEAPLNSRQNRLDMVETMLETFGFKGIKVEYQATLGLYARGLMTGTIFDGGEGVSHVIPVHRGHIFHEAIKRLNLAGRSLTEYLFRLLNARGLAFHSSYDFEQVRMIKEETCFVSLSTEEDLRLARETTAMGQEYQLPDGTWVRLGKERFLALEPLFQPELVGMDQPGISDMIFSSVLACPIDSRRDLMKSVILSGGTTMHPGMVMRVEKDLRRRCKEYCKRPGSQGILAAKVEDPPERRYLVYIGGAAYARILAEKPDACITKQDWDERGPSIV